MKRSTPYLAGAGLLTGVAGVITAQSTVWVLQAKNGPVDAVAALVRDYTPGTVAHWLISRVGDLDKPLLRAGTLIILVLLCTWIGIQARKRPLLPDICYFLLALIGLWAVLRLPDSTVESAMGIVVGLITWIVVGRMLTAPLPGPGDDAGSVEQPARRAFLTRAGAVAVVTAGIGILGSLQGRKRGKVERERRLARLPLEKGTGSVPPGSSLGVAGIASWRTRADDFYLIDTALTPPVIPYQEWNLRVHGMVERELNLTYTDLLSRTLTEDWVTLACVSNEVGGDLIGNAFWSGVLVREVLAQAGVKSGADAVMQTSADGWNCATPLSALTDDRNAMLAVAMNGKPLPVEHGYPVRMVVPGLYGYVSATKWLVDLEVTRFDQVEAYWTERGWSEEGPVLTQSRIDVPRGGEEVEVGRFQVGGVAWAQHTGIMKVEYQLDGGSWRVARLGAAGPDDDTWVQWAGSVELSAGDHTLVVRATDKSGYTQTSVRTDVLPSGATGWHQVDFSAT